MQNNCISTRERRDDQVQKIGRETPGCVKADRREPADLSVLKLLQRRAWLGVDLDRRDVDRELGGLSAATGGTTGGSRRRHVGGATRQTTGERQVDAASIHRHEEGVHEWIGDGVEVGQEHTDLLQGNETFRESQGFTHSPLFIMSTSVYYVTSPEY